MPSAECVRCHGPRRALGTKCFAWRMLQASDLPWTPRLIGVEVLEPLLRLVGYAHVCSLRGICLRLSRRDAFALQRHWRPVIRPVVTVAFQVATNTAHPRVTSGDKGPCMMAAFTASRHFMATLGAPRPRPFWAKCDPHAWRPASLRAHQNVGSNDFLPLCPWSKS